MEKIFLSKYDTKPFLIALYHGQSKPNLASEFFSDFVTKASNQMLQGTHKFLFLWTLWN